MTRFTGRLISAAAALLVLAAGAAVFAGASTALLAPLSLLALTAVAARLAAGRGRGPVDAVLLACGGLLVTMVLAGFLLGISQIGLHPRSWALALGGIALVGLLAAEFFSQKTSDGIAGHDPSTPTQQPDSVRSSTGFSTFGSPGEFGTPVDPGAPGGHDTKTGTKTVLTQPDNLYQDERWVPRLRNLPWAIAVVAVACVALTISVRATNDAEVSPLQMALGSVRGGSAQVVVSSDENSGQLELRTEAPDGTSLSYPLFSVGPGKPVSTSVVLPSQGRFVITLNNPDQSKPLRSLILDR